MYFDDMSAGQKLRFFRDTVRDAEKQHKKALKKSKDQDSLLDMEVCIGDCKSLVNLSKDITKILSRLDEARDPKSFTALKIGELVGLNEYLQYVASDGSSQCITSINNKVTTDFLNYKEDHLQLIFSKEIDVNEFRGLQLHSGLDKQIYFLRGKDENANKVVKVTLRKEHKPQIEIYEISDFDPSEIKFTFKAQELAEDNKKDEEQETKKQKDGILDYSYSLDDTSESGFRGSIGPRITYENEYNLPKRITLIELQGTHEIMDGYKVNSKIEISDRRQEAQMSLANEQGQVLSIIELDKHGDIAVGVPYEISSQTFGLGLRGNTVIGTGKQKISTSVMFEGESYIDASYEKNSDGKSLELGKTYSFERGKSFIAVKFQKKESKDVNDKTFYISYSRTF